jgi:hypothetical protein
VNYNHTIQYESFNKTSLWLEAFAASKCNKIFSGDKPRHHSLMMEAERASEKLEYCSILTRLFSLEDFIEKLHLFCKLL